VPKLNWRRRSDQPDSTKAHLISVEREELMANGVAEVDSFSGPATSLRKGKMSSLKTQIRTKSRNQ
jgi:hypothetical protein